VYCIRFDLHDKGKSVKIRIVEKIIVTGGSGKLGKSLKKMFPDALFPKHSQLDVTKPKQISAFIKGKQPDIVIHAAAITDIRECDKYRKSAWNTNVTGTKNFLDAISTLKSHPLFVYMSTACVFEGNSSFYNENDIPNPKNFYSLTKFVGELLVENSALKNWLIVRTNFVLNSSWPYPKAFTDRFGTYLFTDDVANGLKEILEAKITGIIHLTGNKRVSMYELAKMISPNTHKFSLKDYKGPLLTIDMSLTSIRWKKYKLGKFKEFSHS
jgi:dTDP-4-dehydrorhamnose reductase